MKSVQIPYDLFIDLAMYHLRGEDDYEEEIRQGLEQKLDAMLNRQIYSRYKTAPTEEEREQARQEYLDRRGVPQSYRWTSPKYVPVGIPLVTSKNLVNGVIDYGNVKYITQEDADKINVRSMVDDDDILFAMIGSIGNPVLVKKDREFCIKNMALFKRFANTDISMRYVYWFLFYAQYKLKKEASGGVQSFISLSRFREYLIPLPPVAEQNRIVAKLEEILPLCERLK